VSSEKYSEQYYIVSLTQPCFCLKVICSGLDINHQQAKKYTIIRRQVEHATYSIVHHDHHDVQYYPSIQLERLRNSWTSVRTAEMQATSLQNRNTVFYCYYTNLCIICYSVLPKPSASTCRANNTMISSNRIMVPEGWRCANTECNDRQLKMRQDSRLSHTVKISSHKLMNELQSKDLSISQVLVS
jgi:hypothetical protein